MTTAHDRRSDEMLDAISWEEVESAMAHAPDAQRKEFWQQMIGLLDVGAQFIASRKVSLIAGPLQEAVALSIDDRIRAEDALTRAQHQEFLDREHAA